MAHENYGHRERLRARMMKEGLGSFQDHEVLELLLFQSIPRKDTNKLAHNLLNKFGSFAGVLNASPEQLMTVDGVAETTACNVAMLKEVFVRYQKSASEKINLGKIGSIIKFAQNLVYGVYCEKLIVAYTDHATNHLNTEEYSSNSVDKVFVEPRQIISTAMRLNAAGVIFIHCHVDGVCKPSEADIQFTEQMLFALASVDVVLLEHLIFNNKKEHYSFFNSGMLDKFNEKYKQTFNRG